MQRLLDADAFKFEASIGIDKRASNNFLFRELNHCHQYAEKIISLSLFLVGL